MTVEGVPERLRFLAARLRSRAGTTAIPVVGEEIAARLDEIADEVEPEVRPPGEITVHISPAPTYEQGFEAGVQAGRGWIG